MTKNFFEFACVGVRAGVGVAGVDEGPNLENIVTVSLIPNGRPVPLHWQSQSWENHAIWSGSILISIFPLTSISTQNINLYRLFCFFVSFVSLFLQMFF